MRTHPGIFSFVAFNGMAALLVLALGTETGLGQAKKGDSKKNIAHYVKQLQNRFTSWDTNKDLILDTTELAKAFRGPDAKAYDKLKVEGSTPAANPEAIENFLRTKPTRNSVAVATVLLARCPVNFAVGEIMTWKRTTKTPEKSPTKPVALPDYTKFPDYQFLVLVDTNKDNKITKKEFDTWANSYAKTLDHYDHTTKALQTAQNNLNKAKTAAAKVKASQDVQARQTEVNQALAQVNVVPPAVQAVLKIQK